MHNINETHNKDLESWIESANEPESDFPIQNLPVCQYLEAGEKKIGVAIGDSVLDFEAFFNTALAKGGEKVDMALAVDSNVRIALQEALGENTNEEAKTLIGEHLLRKQSDLEYVKPFHIHDYTDFYCSIYHATNVGRIFRPENPLLPNYRYVPIGYHGRSSSIVMSGSDVVRPKGQNRSDTENPPVYIPSKALDYEMEVGFFVGSGNKLGETIPISKAEEHIFGLCLVNDWSARDIQGWEAQPLGPFLGKSFATTIAPFVVPLEALAPFRVPEYDRGDEPGPLEYLKNDINSKKGGIDMKLEVYIASKQMRDENIEPHLLSRSNLKDLYWTIGQMLTHHASNGCNLNPGDLIATGTVSGNENDEKASLLEITKRGKEPFELPTGETRRFLEDYDEIIMKGFCGREGYRRIGFGECRGVILPAN
ncbi:MAG: fumarylacetoacetase [Acidobacteriota bacterium]|nr:fumarylacetoacetase [Acidobacteriota bacterium]